MSVVPDFRDTAPGAASPHPAPGPPAAGALSPLTAWTLPLCLSSLLTPGSEVGVNGAFRHPLTWQGGRGDPRGVPRVLVAVTGRRARTGLAPSGVRLCGSPLGRWASHSPHPSPEGSRVRRGAQRWEGTLSTRRLWPWAAGVGLSLDEWDPGSGAQEGRRVGGPEESPLFALHPRAGPVRSAPSPAGAPRRRCGLCFNCLSRHEEMPRP